MKKSKISLPKFCIAVIGIIVTAGGFIFGLLEFLEKPVVRETIVSRFLEFEKYWHGFFYQNLWPGCPEPYYIGISWGIVAIAILLFLYFCYGIYCLTLYIYNRRKSNIKIGSEVDRRWTLNSKNNDIDFDFVWFEPGSLESVTYEWKFSDGSWVKTPKTRPLGLDEGKWVFRGLVSQIQWDCVMQPPTLDPVDKKDEPVHPSPEEAETFCSVFTDQMLMDTDWEGMEAVLLTSDEREYLDLLLAPTNEKRCQSGSGNGNIDQYDPEGMVKRSRGNDFTSATFNSNVGARDANADIWEIVQVDKQEDSPDRVSNPRIQTGVVDNDRSGDSTKNSFNVFKSGAKSKIKKNESRPDTAFRFAIAIRKRKK